MFRPQTYMVSRVAAAIAAVIVLIFEGASAAPATPVATSGGASEWVAGHNSRVRLIAGAIEPSGERLIGVEIEAEPGWHTYWRNPGDAGVPPVFDWSASTNLASAEVLWPAPVAIDSGFGISIGYLDGVLFPVRLRPASAGQPIDIALTLDYAVCADICIPLSADLVLTLGPQDPPGAQARRIERALVRVPAAQTGGEDGPQILRARAAQRGGRVVLEIEARAGSDASLFVEGPEEFYFEVPQGGEPLGNGRVRFVVGVDGAPSPESLAGQRLGATLLAADGAIEHWWQVE